jgi:transcription elongation GreA/GreB family factor
MPPPTKASLRDELARILAADLATRERAYRTAREAATHDEAKPENDKDTRALEQSYLARGEALRIDELRTALAELDAMVLRDARGDAGVALGALVAIDEDDVRSLFWIAPHGGGSHLANRSVQVLTPRSPLARALLGKRAGEECEVALAGKTRLLTVVSVG